MAEVPNLYILFGTVADILDDVESITVGSLDGLIIDKSRLE